MYALYDWEINYAQLNLLDSHDTARALWIMGEDKSALRLCVLLQMTMPGAPCIYYGDEIGLSGGDDPYCRQAFPWDNERTWDTELLTYYRRLAALRQSFPALCRGAFETLYAQDQVYAFHRVLAVPESTEIYEALVLVNAATAPAFVDIPLPGESAAPTSRPGRKRTAPTALKTVSCRSCCRHAPELCWPAHNGEMPTFQQAQWKL